MSEDFLKEFSNERTNSTISKTGLITACITGGTAVALSVVCLPFISPGFRRICLPYVPATTTQVKNVMTALQGKSGKVVDLGSGDGRIVLSAAKHGYSADGVELNIWLILYSRLQAFKQGLSKKTSFYRQDLWKFSLSPYQNVIIFGVEKMMPELEKKCLNELENNSNIIACRFPFTGIEAISKIGSGVDAVWTYKVVK